MRLLIATTNPGKIREVRHALGPESAFYLTIDAVAPDLTPPEETGRTFAANAELKARYYARRTGLTTLAEDSGLSIDALGGRPGVESARYPGATYLDKFENLYRELAHHPRPWTAYYTCAITVVSPAGAIDYAGLATVHGEIARGPRGSHGFGYDPIFFFPPYGCTTGEMTDAQKLGISHRGRALRQFRQWMEAARGQSSPPPR